MALSPISKLLALTQSKPDVISLAGGLPASELLDVQGIASAFRFALNHNGSTHLQYSPPEGIPALREQLSQRMAANGIAADPASIVVTTGAQQALLLTVALLLSDADTVLVEEPTYLAALQCFQLFGARVVSVPSGPSGIDIAALEASIVRERPTMIYLVPTFANPTGRTLSVTGRLAVIDVAGRHRVWLVEDDPYSDLRYRGEAVPPLAALAPEAAKVIYCGSLSKICAPGLRLGWLHGPEELIDAATVAKQVIDLNSSTVDQAAVADYLANTDLCARLREIRRAYGARRDAILTELEHLALPSHAEWTDPDGGMFVWLRLGDGIDTEALLPDAIDAGVAFVPGAPFYAERPDTSTMRMSFVSHHPAGLRVAMQRLNTVLKSAGI
jgi:DNA-binding transcriptional MocR family regulator